MSWYSHYKALVALKDANSEIENALLEEFMSLSKSQLQSKLHEIELVHKNVYDDMEKSKYHNDRMDLACKMSILSWLMKRVEQFIEETEKHEDR